MNISPNILVNLDINLAALVLLIGVLGMSLRVTNHKDARGGYYITIIVLMIINAAITVSLCFIEKRPDATFEPLAMLLNTVLEISYTLVMAVWLFYAMYDLFKSKDYIRRKRWIVLGPALILAAVPIINLFVPIIFTCDHVNGFLELPFYRYYNIPRFFYIIVSVYQTTEYHRREKTRGVYNIWLFLIPLVASAILETMTTYTIMTLGCAIGLTSLYVVMINEMGYKDFESGFYNAYYLSYLYNLTDKGKYELSSIISFSIKDGENVEAFSEAIKTVLPDECDTIRTGSGSFITISESTDRGYVYMLTEDISTVAEEAGFFVNTESIVRGKKEDPADFFIDNIRFKKIGRAV